MSWYQSLAVTIAIISGLAGLAWFVDSVEWAGNFLVGLAGSLAFWGFIHGMFRDDDC